MMSSVRPRIAGDEAETQAQEQRNATVKEIFERLDVAWIIPLLMAENVNVW